MAAASRPQTAGFNEDTLDGEKALLLNQRAEIVRILHTIRKNLITHHQPVIEEKPYAEARHQSSELFDKRTKRFTDRGQERARYLFQKFTNSQGKMGYFEFRVYLESVGRPHEFHPYILKSKEAWCCFMHDLVGLDEDGYLTHESFICYRQGIEHLFPLEFDLVRVKLDVLPQRLVDWKTFNSAFLQIVKDNGDNNEEGNIDNSSLSIPTEEMQYLAFASGETIPLSTCRWLHLLSCRHNMVMSDIQAHFKKHNRFSSTQSVSFDPTNIERIFFRPMTGLWFSNRPHRILREFHQKALEFKLGFSRWIRRSSDMFSTFADRLRSIVDFGYLIPAIIAREKAEVGRYAVSVDVGDLDGVEDAFGANISLTRIKNPARCFAEMGLAAGVGSVLFIDLVVRPDASDLDVATAVVKLNETIDANLKQELDRHHIFHSLKVYPWTHETDDIPIVRIAFMLRAASNIDVFLKKFEVGLKFADILPEFAASINFNSSLNTILESKRFVLGQDLAVSANMSATVARRIVSKIFEEILYFIEQDASQERVEKLERKGLFEVAVERSREAIFGKKASSNNKKDLSSTDTSSHQDVSITGFQEDHRHKVDSQIASQSFATKVMRFLAWCGVTFFKTTKATNSDYSAPNFSELLFGNAWLRSRLPSWINRNTLEDPGHVALLWSKSLDWLVLNLKCHWKRVLNNEKAEEIWQEQRERKHQEKLAKMSQKERANYEFMEEKRALAAKLKDLGIDTGGALEVEKETIDNVSFLRNLANEELQSERLLLETYDACCNGLFGVHSLVLQCGAHRLAVEIQGCDIFDMLPKVDDGIVK